MKLSKFRLGALLALLVFLPGLVPAAPENNPVTLGEAATLAITPALHRHLVIIGRVSSAVYQPGVLVGKDDYILTAVAPSLDKDVESPYLVMLPDGRRVVAEVVHEDKSNGMVLLKSPELPAGLEPAPIAGMGDASWFVAGAWSPAPTAGETPRIHLGRVVRRPENAGGPLVLDLPLHTPGSPIFDLAGRLVAIARKTAPDRLASTCVPIAEIVKAWPEVPVAVAVSDAPKPPDIEITDTDVKGSTVRQKLPAPAWTTPLPIVTVLQGERNVAVGTILSADGLILTKASEIGDAPSCQLGDKTWPAALLAVDEETDLALLRIDVAGLPAVHWHEAVPAPGAWLYSPISASGNESTFSCGLVSHRMAVPRATTTLDQPECITSLGIVLEQASSAPVVAALPGGETDGGLRRGDQLKTLDGKSITSRAELTAALASRRVGERAELAIVRDGKPATLAVTLAASLPSQPSTAADRDKLASLASFRRSGFPDVLSHDGTLDATSCGGPVVDSQGRMVGLNIARADRGASLALTVPAIQAACKRLLSQPESF